MSLGMERVAPWPLGGAAASPMDRTTGTTEGTFAGMQAESSHPPRACHPGRPTSAHVLGLEWSAFSPALNGRDAWR